MSLVQFVTYSPLCDTDRSVYYEYLNTCRRVGYGQYVKQFGWGDGAGGCEGRGSGGVDLGGCIDGSVVTEACEGFDAKVVDGSRLSSLVDQFGLDNSVDVAQESARGSIGGLAGCDVGRGCGGLRGDVPVGSGAGGNADASDGNGPVESVVCDSLPGRVRRGPNYERNKRSRDAKKRSKAKLHDVSKDWRADRALKQAAVGRVGFFSECDDGVRKQLRESRAKLLIVENNRKAAEEELKLKRCLSPQSLVRELISVTSMAAQLKKQTKDHAIGGWAESVVDHLTRSVAESAPSSVPSLQSVGVRDSVSSGGSVFDAVRELRMTEYKMMLSRVESSFEQMEAYSEQEYDDSILEIKEMYSDVAYTVAEREARAMSRKVSEAMYAVGMGYEKVDEVVAILRSSKD